MTTNRELLQKADIAVGDLTTNGGLLTPEQGEAFIHKMFTPQVALLSKARRVVMTAPTRYVNKIGFDQGIMRDAAGISASPGGTPMDAQYRSKPVTERITLTTKEAIAEIWLPYDVIEDNIERGNIGMRTDVGGTATSGGVKDTIMTLIGERAGADLENLAVNGDSAGAAGQWLSFTDGWLKRLSSNVVNASGAPISRRVLTDGMKTLPSQYRGNRAQLAHFLSTENEIDYRETLAQRETALGDAQLTSTAPVYGAGAPVVGVGYMPAAQGMLVNPMNLLIGVQRDIHIETDKDIRSRTYIIVLTMRLALQVEEELAAVRYSNIGS